MQTHSQPPNRQSRRRTQSAVRRGIDPDKLYNLPETYQYTGAGQSKTYVLKEMGLLNFTKLGRRSFITGSELIRFRREHLGIAESA